MSKKYLIGDKAGKLYTVTATEEGLQELTEVEGHLSASLFEERGFDTVPESGLLTALANPSVYCWMDSGIPKLRAVMAATPYPQVVLSENKDMSDRTIMGVENVEIDSDDNTLFAVSADDGETWWNYINYTWVQLSSDASGQTKSEMEEISTSAWADFATTGMIRFRFVLAAASNYVNEIRINYLNTETGESAQRVLQSITIKKPPNKCAYILGDTLDLTGITVVASYDTGQEANVTAMCAYSPRDCEPLIKAGTQNVGVSYTESGITKTAVFEINVQT